MHDLIFEYILSSFLCNITGISTNFSVILKIYLVSYGKATY